MSPHGLRKCCQIFLYLGIITLQHRFINTFIKTKYYNHEIREITEEILLRKFANLEYRPAACMDADGRHLEDNMFYWVAAYLVGFVVQMTHKFSI